MAPDPINPVHPVRCLLVAFLALLLLSVPRSAAAQSGPLSVTIARPGEGETLYAGPDSPRTAVHVLGRVTGGDFDLSEIEVRLVVIQDGAPAGQLTGAPDANGAFNFWVSINPFGPEEAGRSSSNCWPCHGYAPVALPSGPSVIRVTAIEPTGRTSVAERRVRVDRSGTAQVDVRITIAGQPAAAVVGLPVTASTRLYDWRSRQFSAKTDASGRAALAVEALSQAATVYRIGLPPTIVDGTLYHSSRPVEITLPAGAAAAGPVDLPGEAQLGRIDGVINGPGQAAPAGPVVHAIELLSGRAFTAQAAGGKFSFADLPIGRYLVAADPDEVAARGYRPARTDVDLAARIQATCALDLGPSPDSPGAQGLRGTVRDASGQAAPFAWFETSDGKSGAPAGPVSGVFAWPGVAAGGALRVSAPGYWSRPIPARGGANVDVRLELRPDTRIVSWGSGRLLLPAATLADVNGGRITLRRGWAWGSGDGLLTIDTPDTVIRVDGPARLALEYFPGETGWLFVLEGEARAGPATVKAGQMAAFAGKDIAAPQPVPLDETALRLLQQERVSPVPFEAAPGPWSRLEEALAYAGIAAPRPVPAAGLAGAAALLAIGAVYIMRRGRR